MNKNKLMNYTERFGLAAALIASACAIQSRQVFAQTSPAATQKTSGANMAGENTHSPASAAGQTTNGAASANGASAGQPAAPETKSAESKKNDKKDPKKKKGFLGSIFR